MEVWRWLVGEEPPPTIPLSSLSSPFVDRARSAYERDKERGKEGGREGGSRGGKSIKGPRMRLDLCSSLFSSPNLTAAARQRPGHLL